MSGAAATADQRVDYGADVDAPPPDNVLAVIDQLAQEQLAAERAVEDAEEALRRSKERLRDLSERQLPEAMAQARQKRLTTLSDITVELRDQVRASLPKERADAGLRWLREHDHSAIIKTRLEVPFEAGREEAARGVQALLILLATRQELRDALCSAITGYTPGIEVHPFIIAALDYLASKANEGPDRFALSSTVHAQTLMALVRELLRDGKIDQTGMDALGAHAWKAATVKAGRGT